MILEREVAVVEPWGDHIDLPRIVFEFDKHQWSMLRRLIDRLNENTPT